MISVTLLSRRDPKGDWCIRNRIADNIDPGDERELKAARDKAAFAKMRWQSVEPSTDFMIEEVSQ